MLLAAREAAREAAQEKEAEAHRVALASVSDAARALVAQSAQEVRDRAEREAEASAELSREQKLQAAALIEFQASLQQVAQSIQHEQQRLLETQADDAARRQELGEL